MKRISLSERPNWRAEAERLGFHFATINGEPYWDETSAYQFTLHQIEDHLEDPATGLHAMCREAVGHIIQSESQLARMGLPQPFWDYIAASWYQDEPELYGRLDLVYDGQGPAKLLEYNADTPTSLYESASFQWLWLEQQIEAGAIPADSDQFNGIHDALVERFRTLFAPNTDVHFAAIEGNPEDYGTVETLAWTAREAGLGAHYTDLEKIGITAGGQFADGEDRIIANLFKLYPWEDLLQDDFARHIAASNCRFIEPPWKSLLSNKAILPILWEMYPGHPNLLPAFFADDIAAGRAKGADAALAKGYVEKPIFSREGASINIVENGAVTHSAPNRDYDDHPKIWQAYHPLPDFDGMFPIIGAWVIGRECKGIGIREDRSLITQDTSLFKPHFFVG